MRIIISAIAAFGVAVTAIVAAQTRPPQAPAGRPATAPTGAAARGEYLVNSVAMCVQCHSPRTQDGDINADRKLTGAPIPVRGPVWSADWAVQAPAIAGLPGFTDEQVVMLLTEGHAGDRDPPRRPMPPFRMNTEDAQAVAAYLRSLGGR